MTLAGMIRTDESALICDLAETYGIFNYKKYPVRMIGILCSGLGDDSRIKRKISGVDTSIANMLLATIADRLGILVWIHTEDGRRNRNRPKSILDQFLKNDSNAGEIEKFSSGCDFEKEWERIKNEITGGDR